MRVCYLALRNGMCAMRWDYNANSRISKYIVGIGSQCVHIYSDKNYCLFTTLDMVIFFRG